MTAGSLLLEAAGRAGLFGIMTRSSGPQIRGGEAAALLRISTRPVSCHGDRFDLLLAIDWLNADRFAAEISLDENSIIVGDQSIPDVFSCSAASFREISFKQIAAQSKGLRPNMIALGLIGAAIGLAAGELKAVSTNLIGKKGQAAVEASLGALAAGAARAELLEGLPALHSVGESRPELWNISGNEATGLGAVRGGIRFVAAYPITPATEILEWLAPALEKLGGVLVQAEDELASVNQLIGASFGGTPSLTATSGPGFALMTESIGLAIASETPIVVVDVMRGGPSTGIPTKSEQSDLNIALYGLHGDAPHIVVAPFSVGDCLLTTQWAVHLAETLQTAVIVLSDQSVRRMSPLSLAACCRPRRASTTGDTQPAAMVFHPWHCRDSPDASTPRRASNTAPRERRRARPKITRNNSTNAGTNCNCTTMAIIGRKSKARARWRF